MLPPSDGQEGSNRWVSGGSTETANVARGKKNRLVKPLLNEFLVWRVCTVHRCFVFPCDFKEYVLKIVLINK